MLSSLPNGNIVDSCLRFDGGIADFPKTATDNEYSFGRSIDVRSDVTQVSLLTKTTKESGSVVLGLPKSGDVAGTDVYYYDNAGNIYKRTSSGAHSLERSVSSSHGNGMKYYSEDDFLYYASDKVIGRYGQISGTPVFTDDFLGSEGGVPLNTNVIHLTAASSQYASRADTASLSITGDLCIEGHINPDSLPTAGNSMVLFSKWDENSNKRSYKFEIYAVSGYFGDGSDGALTISSDTTEAPIDSACTGTHNAYSLSATNASFTAGQVILIHQTRGTGAGTWQRTKIASYTAGTITTEDALNATYTSGAQVRVLKQYTNVTINSAKTYTAKAWDGTVGGILAFLANGTVTVTGTITATGKGFRGGAGANGTQGTQGEGNTGTGTALTTANTQGGGGGKGDTGNRAGGGGGGGHSTPGSTGTYLLGTPGVGGLSAGTADLTTVVFGGGGGGGARGNGVTGTGGTGGTGGGFIFISGTTVTVTGFMTSAGTNGSAGSGDASGGGAGAGGAVLIKAQTVTLGSSLVTASAGTGGASSGSAQGTGGNGGTGRIHLDYYTSYTGTTSPTLDVTQDNNLVTNTTYQLRLALSSDGTAEEFLTKNSTITADAWAHVAVSWDASEAQATFYQDGVSLGTSTGAAVSLNDNASVAGLGCDFDSAAQNFFDGYIDEVRVWNTVRSQTQIYNNKEIYIADNSAGLVAWYKLNGDVTDSQTSGNNDLTAANTPTYSTDVPYSAPTTRQDLDQSLDTSGDTYALATSISESATNRQTFVPDKVPQKSIEVNISDTGDDSDWTLTVHDALDRVVATATVTHANLHTGDFEFTFDSVWTPIRGASYHFHLTATTTTGTPTVVSTSSNDLETADFHTYYQFLVEDTDYHPIEQMLNFLVIGNGRYVAKYAADGTYEPHKLSLPAGWKVRCFGFWKGYLAIGCWKGTNVYDTDKGIIFLWDGISDTYNDYFVVAEGAVNALLGARGKLHVWAGYHGDMYVYNGGDSIDEPEMKRVPKIEETEYIETMPGAVAMWGGLIRWGAAGASDAANVERGVYTYGRKKAASPNSLTYDYPISTGARASTGVKIGLCIPVGRKLLIGWQSNVSYGVDVTGPSASPFSSGTIEKSIKDYGRVSKEKQALNVRVDLLALEEGQSVQLKYRLDRNSSWILSDLVDTAGKTRARLPIIHGSTKNNMFREIEIACDLYTTTSTSPTVIEFGLEFNPKKTDAFY